MSSIFFYNAPILCGLDDAGERIAQIIERYSDINEIRFYDQIANNQNLFNECIDNVRDGLGFNLVIRGNYYLNQDSYIDFINRLYASFGCRDDIESINQFAKSKNLSIRMIVPTSKSFSFIYDSLCENSGRIFSKYTKSQFLLDWVLYHHASSHIFKALGFGRFNDPDRFFLPKSYRGGVNNCLFAGPGISFIDFEVWYSDNRRRNPLKPYKVSCAHRGQDGYRGYPWFSVIKKEADF